MNKAFFVNFCVILLVSIIGGIAIFYVLGTELKLGFAIIVSILTLLLFLLLFGFKKDFILSSSRLRFVTSINFPLLYSLSLLAIILIPSVDSQIMMWNLISPVTYLKLFFSILVSFLLPGFAVLKILDKGKSLSLLESLAFSYIISLLITSLFGFNFIWLYIANLCLLVLSFYFTIMKKEAKISLHNSNISVLKVGILLCAFLLFSSFIFSIFSDFWLFIGPDFWRHYGWTLNIMKGVPEISMVERMFHFLYAGFFQLSGFPFVNAWIVSIPLLFMTVLAFYLMASTYIGKLDRRAPLLSTIIWAFFSGFGWIYALSMRVSGEMNWLGILQTTQGETHLDIGYSPGFWTFMGDNPPVAIGFTALFLLLYLVRKKDFNNKLRYILCTVTFFVGFALHTVEALFFFVIIPLLALLKVRASIKHLLLSITSACLIILSYDFLYQVIYFGNFIMTSTAQFALYVFFASLTGWVLISLFTRKLVLPVIRFPQVQWRTKYALMIAIVVAALSYLYGISVYAWIEVKDVYWWSYTLPYRFIPWYFYPILLGVVGLLFVGAISFSRPLYKKYKDVLVFLLASAALLFFLGRFISFVNLNFFDTRFNETRTLSFLFIPLAMLASMSIIYIFGKLLPLKNGFISSLKNTKLKRLAICGILFVIIVTSGIFSTLMTAEYWTLHSRNSQNEISLGEVEALDFLRHNTNPAAYAKDIADYNLVFTLTDVSYQSLQAFSGTGSYLQYAYKGLVLFDAKRLEQPLYFFNAYQTNFLYMAQRDYEQLSTMPQSFLGQYLQFLNRPYENENATIYEVPRMSPPVLNSETAIILPTLSNYTASSSLATLMFAKSYCNYTVMVDSDAGLYDKGTLALPSDPHKPIPYFSDDAFTDGWTKSTDALNSVIDGDILDLSFNNKENNSVLVSYERHFPETIDTSIYQHLVWRLYIEDMVKDHEQLVDYAGIRLYDDDAKDWFWVGAVTLTNPDFAHIRKGVWVDVTFDAQDNMWHKFGRISKMQIVLRVSPGETQEIKTDHVAFYEDTSFMYGPGSTTDLIQWVENGGRLLVIDSDGLGAFSDLIKLNELSGSFVATGIKNNSTEVSIPQIKVPYIVSLNPVVEVLARYTDGEHESPLALRQTVDNGEIVYLFAEPYISAMLKEGDNDKKVQLFTHIESLLKMINLPLPIHKNVSDEVYKATINEATLMGYTDFNSECVILPKNLEILDLVVNSTNPSSFQFNGLEESLLSDIKAYGDVNWDINAQNVNITSGGIGLYTRLLIGDEFRVTLNLYSNSSSIYMEVQDRNSSNTTSYTLAGIGSLKFKINIQQPLEVFIRAPSVFANGTSLLGSFYLDKVLYDYGGNNVVIHGPLSFNVGYSDTFTLLSDFKMEENSQMQVLNSNRLWDEWNDVPWVNILTSAGHLLLIISVVIIFIVSYLGNLKIEGAKTSNDKFLPK
jgi:hypothetical protein